LTELVRRSPGGEGFFIVRGTATYYNKILTKMGVNRICFERFYAIKIFPKLISFILTRQGGPFGVHASSWCSHKN
jgi:hypothetical protein